MCGGATMYQACQAFYGFRNRFSKFNNTGARMLGSIYHMTKYFEITIYGIKMLPFGHKYAMLL